MKFREEVSESLTLKFAESAARRREQGLPIISLGLGEPDFDTPKQIIDAAKNVLDQGTSKYSSPLGLMDLRKNLASKFIKDNGIACSAENILVAAGAKQAFQIIAMALLEPGDEVIVVTPAFVSFIPQLLIAEPECQVKTLEVKSADFSFPVDKLSRMVTDNTKLIVINSPNNPAGYVLTEQEVRDIYQIAERHDCYLVSDEIYEKLNFSTHAHFSAGSLESEPLRVITINGYSKSHAMTGWRVGYACFPKQLSSRILKIQQHMNTNTCTFIQKALVDAAEVNESYLDEYRKVLAERCDIVVDWESSVHEINLCAPRAGFFAFFDISNLGMSSNEFCGSVIESVGVAMTPGIAFGQAWDTHVRLSFAVPEDTLKEGLRLISSFISGVKK